jgi:hypothetical protein
MTEQSKRVSRASELGGDQRSEPSSSRSIAARKQGRSTGNGGRGGAAIATRAVGQVSRALEKRIAKPGADLGKLAKSLRLTGEQLEGNAAAPYVEKLALGLEKLSGVMGDIDPQKAIQGVERFARNRPWVFLSGALGLGFLGARFMKSSASAAS